MQERPGKTPIKTLAIVFVFTIAAATVFVWLLSTAVLAGNEWLGGSRFERRAAFSDCTRTASLGAWLKLKCGAGTVVGRLEKVAGEKKAIEAEIVAFQAFHNVPWTCSKAPSGGLRCSAGAADLSTHLSENGFKAASDQNKIQTLLTAQAWIATLMGFGGAAIVFVFNAQQQRDTLLARTLSTNDKLTKLEGILISALTRVANGAREQGVVTKCVDDIEKLMDDMALLPETVETLPLLRDALNGVRTALKNRTVKENKSALVKNLETAFERVRETLVS